MEADFKWPKGLKYRRGAPTRLEGIDLFYDFKWSEVFVDRRAQFRNGQCLARQVRKDSPEGKRPALLLTALDDVEEDSFESPTFFVMVINLPRYMKVADGDAAISYLAGKFGSGITKLAQFSELASRPKKEINNFLEQQLTGEWISSWAAGNAERLEELRQIVGEETGDAESSIPEAVAALEALDGLDEEVVTALAGLLGPDMDRDARLALLRTLTDDSAGRRDAGEIMGQRATLRLDDARRTTDEFTTLLNDSGSSETDLQRFIEDNIWLLGLHYVQIRPRYPVMRGELDFILERYDGFHDLLELKSPQDRIVEAPDAVPPPSASKYKLSTTLSKALAQVHIYRHALTEHAAAHEGPFGLPNSRDPRILIVIGSAATLADHRADVLRELNKSLHRVEIVPYDILAERASGILDSVEKYLTIGASETAAAN